LIESVAADNAGHPEGFAKIRPILNGRSRIYQFREFRLDVAARRVSRGEGPVHLPPKPLICW
jgi:hypothetical protein